MDYLSQVSLDMGLMWVQVRDDAGGHPTLETTPLRQWQDHGTARPPRPTGIPSGSLSGEPDPGPSMACSFLTCASRANQKLS